MMITSRLLNLPAELRLNIYGFAVSSAPLPISIEDYASNGPLESIAARSLVVLDPEYAEEIMEMYWSSNIFQYSPWINDLSGTRDKVFEHWLNSFIGDSAKHVKGLKFKECLPPKHRPDGECKLEIEINLAQEEIFVWPTGNKKCPCNRAAIVEPSLREAFESMPRVKGKLHPSKETLWDLYARCFFRGSYRSLRPLTMQERRVRE